MTFQSRFTYSLGLLAASLQVAAGGDSPAKTPPPAARRVVLASDFGLVPGATPKANRLAIQAAIDAPGGSKGRVVLLPAADIALDRPIIADANHLAIRGQGAFVTRLISHSGHDAIAVGVQRTPNGATLTAGNLPDLWTAGPRGSPILDKSAITGRAQKHGLRTFGKTHLRQQGGSLDQGVRIPSGPGADHYVSCSGLTIDVLADLSRVPAASNVTIAGLFENGQGRPWVLGRVNGNLWLGVTTYDGRVDVGTFHYYAAIPQAAPNDNGGVCRITAQVDLATAKVNLWVNGTASKVILAGGPPLKPGDRLIGNEHSPFTVGLAQKPINGAGADITIAGLKVSGAPLYASTDPGMAQTRLDSQPITDATRYFRGERSLIGLLPLNDDPADVAATRVLSVYWGKLTSAYFLDNQFHSAGVSSTNIEVTDVAVYSQGSAITVGLLWGLKIHDCDLRGDAFGIGSLSLGGSWPVTIRDCALRGADSPLFLFMAYATNVQGISFVDAYRCAARFNECSLSLRDTFSPHWGKPDFGFKLNQCGATIENAAFDNEGSGAGSQIATIYATAGEESPSYFVSVKNFGDSSGCGPNSSVVVLADGPTARGRPCRFTMESGGCYDVPRHSVIRTLGGNWRGKVTMDSPITKSPMLAGKSGITLSDAVAAPEPANGAR